MASREPEWPEFTVLGAQDRQAGTEPECGCQGPGTGLTAAAPPCPAPKWPLFSILGAGRGLECRVKDRGFGPGLLHSRDSQAVAMTAPPEVDVVAPCSTGL